MTQRREQKIICEVVYGCGIETILHNYATKPAKPHVKVKAEGLAGLDGLGAVVAFQKGMAHGFVHSAPLVGIKTEQLVQQVEHLVTGKGGKRVNGAGCLLPICPMNGARTKRGSETERKQGGEKISRGGLPGVTEQRLHGGWLCFRQAAEVAAGQLAADALLDFLGWGA